MEEEFDFEDFDKEFAEFQSGELENVEEDTEEDLFGAEDIDVSAEHSFDFEELTDESGLSDPFAEEFDNEDVINKSELDSEISKKDVEVPDQGGLGLKFSDEDIERIVGYDENRRKNIAFKDEVTEEVKIDPNMKTDIDNQFADFLQAPRISGRGKLKGDAHVYQNQNINDTGHVIEIVGAPNSDKKHGAATIAVNRDDSGEVDHIEIICTCGERIMLKFDYTDNLAGEQTKIFNPQVAPNPFHIDAQKEALNDYDKDLFEEDDNSFFESNSELETGLAVTDSSREPTQESIEEEEIVWDTDFGVDDGELDMGDIDLSGI